jgi:hypothetical protein
MQAADVLIASPVNADDGSIRVGSGVESTRPIDDHLELARRNEAGVVAEGTGNAVWDTTLQDLDDRVIRKLGV